MAYGIGVSLVWLLLLTVAFSLVTWAYRRRVKRLERSMLTDPTTLTGTPFALERDLAHAVESGAPLSVTEIGILDASRALEAGLALRSACWHGVDQLFCIDLSRGLYLLLTLGRLDPEMVASFFFLELSARQIRSSIGWAYTESADPEDRKKVRQSAAAARARLGGDSGYRVELIARQSWGQPVDMIVGDFRARREAVCITAKELGELAGVDQGTIGRIEEGRAAAPRLAARVSMALWTIEHAIMRVGTIKKKEASFATHCTAQPETVAAPPVPGVSDAVGGG